MAVGGADGRARGKCRGDDADGSEDVEYRRRGGGRIIAALAIVVGLLLFVTQNTDRVRIDFLVASARVSLIWALLACVVLGFLLGFLLGRPGRIFGPKVARRKRQGGTDRQS